MLAEIQTAAPCDRSFNALRQAYAVYNDHEIGIEEDEAPQEIVELASALDDLVHETWVPGYLEHSRRSLINNELSKVEFCPQPRLGRAGYELVTAGALKNVLSRFRTEYREVVVEVGDQVETWLDEIPTKYDDFRAVAREAIVDCLFRLGSPSFELRVCPQDGNYFIPRRAGRGRFCRDGCRAAFAARDDAFTCGFCERKRTPREYSGLILAPEQRDAVFLHYGDREGPFDLRMSRYNSWIDDAAAQGHSLTNRNVCADCIQAQRPAWVRYLVRSPDATRERVQ